MRENALHLIPSELVKCRLLEQLVLSRNKISALPLWIYRLHSLQILDIEGNCLTKISSGLGQMQSLKMLNVAANQISSIPVALGMLSNTLVDLDISKNPLPPEIMVELAKGTKPFLVFLRKKLKEDFFLEKFDNRFVGLAAVCPLLFDMFLPHRFNLVLLGPEKSGKTSIFQSLCFQWPKADAPTPGSNLTSNEQGISVQSRTITLKKKAERVEVNLWDFAGSELSVRFVKPVVFSLSSNPHLFSTLCTDISSSRPLSSCWW